MKVLVTGCAGFIGSHLIDQLIVEGYDVIGIDNLSNGERANIQPALDTGAFQFVVHDLVNTIDYSFPPIDIIVHLAACGSVPRSVEQPSFFLQNNVTGFQNVLEFARKNTIKTVFYASSSSVYGDSQKFYRSERDPLNPKSPYAATKLMNEIMADVYQKCYGIDCHGLRFFNVFGPRQKMNSPYAAVVPKFCESIVNRQEVNIFGDGTQRRTMTPINFVIEVICRLMAIREKVKNDVINITCSDYAIGIAELAQLMIRLLNEDRVKVLNLPSRLGDIKSSIGTGHILRELFEENLAEQFPQIEALQMTCDWYKAKLTQQ